MSRARVRAVAVAAAHRAPRAAASCGRGAGDRRPAARGSTSSGSAGLPDAQEARPSRRPTAARRRCRSARPRCSSSTTNWPIANVKPPTTAAGQTARTPRLPSTMPTRISGTNSASSGVWRPTIAPRSSFGSSVSSASVTIGVAIAPNATGAVLATSATAAAFIGLKPTRDQHHRGDRHRRAEAGQRLEQRAEAEGDDHGLDPLVVGDRRERAPQHREVPGLDGHVVDPDRVPDDPHDREQAEARAEHGGVERLADRHRVDDDRDQDRHDQRARAPPSAPSASARRAARTACEREQRERARSGTASRRPDPAPACTSSPPESFLVGATRAASPIFGFVGPQD